MAVIAPTITSTVRDTNPDTIALTGDDRILVKYCSNAYVQMFPEAYNGATINYDKCFIHGNEYMGSKTINGTEGTYERITSNTFTFEVEDSLGSYRFHTHESPCVEYVKLTCNPATMQRPDGNGNMTAVCYGNYFNGNFGVCDNEITCTYHCWNEAGTFYDEGEMTVEVTGNSYIERAYLENLDYTDTYTFYFSADDLVSIAGNYAYGITGKPLFHWGRSDFTFEVPVHFNGGTDGVTLNGKTASLAEYGEWTPVLEHVDASYTRQEGWYIKAGNIVTIGFNIKAVCTAVYYDGSELEPSIEISGMPYEAAYTAYGGGICSGARVSSNKNLQGFSIETWGCIVPRGQDCGDTNGTNLATSMMAFYYPLNGEVTLGGTITYMVFE